MEEKATNAGVEKFYFVSVVKGADGNWWKKNPTAMVEIVKIANTVTLWFDELKYSESDESIHEPRYTTKLVFDTKIPAQFCPRKPIYCDLSFIGFEFRRDHVYTPTGACGRTGLVVQTDGSIETFTQNCTGAFVLAAEKSRAGFDAAECTYTTELHTIAETELKFLREKCREQDRKLELLKRIVEKQNQIMKIVLAKLSQPVEGAQLEGVPNDPGEV